METRIKMPNHERSVATGRYLDDRLAHVEKLLGADAKLARCEVEISRDAGRPRHGKNIWSTEIQIKRPGRPAIRATNHSESVNGSIDDAKEEIARQIRSEKRQRESKEKRRGSQVKGMLRRG